jgi:hypothetical protein
MPTKGLKKFLKTLTKEELIDHITELDKKYKPVQEYHQVYLASDLTDFIEKQKKIIENEFFPTRGLPKMRLSVARKAISDAKKMGFPIEAMADLMLVYVEIGVRFTNDFGDNDEPFYDSMEKMYRDALTFIHIEDLQEKFKERAWEIVENAADTGWGFHDTLGDFFYEYYS